MAKILYITNGMSSTLHSSFELSRRLIAAGHEVTYASPADVGDQVEGQGYAFSLLSRDLRMTERMKQDRRPPISRPGQIFAWLRRRRALRRESVIDHELDDLIKRLTPDLLLIDVELHAVVITTARFRIPTLLPIVWFTVYRHPGLPPLHTHLGPDAGRLTIELAWLRLRVASALWRLRGRLWAPRFFRPISWTTLNVGDLAVLARSRGFNLQHSTDRAQWLRPHLYRDLTVLSFNVWEMELPHVPHPNLRYVGPMVDRKRREARLDQQSMAAWRRFCVERDNETGDRPLVYCSLGSYWSADRDFLLRVLAVFARRVEWDLVLGLGGKLDPADLAPAPANALVLRWAPQLEVLERASCAITHGGITTINECIAFGVPMVVYSTAFVDQSGCAVRVAYHHLGITGDKDADGSHEIEAKIGSVMSDPEIQQNVGIMRQTFIEYQARREVEQVVAAALRSQPREVHSVA